MKIQIIIATFFLTTSVLGQDTNLYKKIALLEYGIDFKGDKYGILTDSGKVKYQYDTIIYLGLKDYYFAKKSGKWGVVDREDQYILPFEYEMIERTWYNNSTGIDTFIVQKNGLIGTVDFKNNVVIPFKYDALSSWCEYGPKAHYARKNGKIGLIKRDGENIIPLEYDSLHYYGPALIKGKVEQKFGILDSKNEVIIPFEYDALIVDFDYMGMKSPEHQDKFVVLKKEEWQYIDPSGNIIRRNVPEEEIKEEYADFQLTNYDLTYTEYCLIERIKMVSPE